MDFLRRFISIKVAINGSRYFENERDKNRYILNWKKKNNSKWKSKNYIIEKSEWWKKVSKNEITDILHQGICKCTRKKKVFKDN